MFIGVYNKSVIMTYCGVAAAVGGSFIAFSYPKIHIKYAFICLVFAGVCDMLDGIIARRIERTEDEKVFGVEIDSLSDMFNFIALPVIIFYNLGMTQIFHAIIYLAYVLGAVIRLAYFNMSVLQNGNTDEPVKYYTGLPVTTCSFIFPVMWLIGRNFKPENMQFILIAMMGLIAIMFVTKMKIPKSRGAANYILSATALAMIALLVLAK